MKRSEYVKKLASIFNLLRSNILFFRGWLQYRYVLSIIAVIFILLAMSIGYLNSPIANGRIVRLKVKSGDTLKTLIKHYQEHQLIRSPYWAYVYGRFETLFSNKMVYRGEYELSDSMTTIQLLNRVFNDQHIYNQIELTIPEGYNIYEIAQLMVQKKIIQEPSDFLKWTSSKELIQKYDVSSFTLEGYLYPTTYFFLENQSVKQMVKRMLHTFWNRFPMQLYQDKKKNHEFNLSIHEVVSLASLIEKETRVPDERALVSAVFHNRLKRQMRLQSDPTVIYALILQNRYRGNLSKKRGDLQVRSLYNTYRYRGITPSPIANPGYDSIKSVLQPESVDYIFFVAKDGKSHAFANNIRDHNRNVAKYVKWLAKRKLKKRH